jgi:hypothetical protein
MGTRGFVSFVADGQTKTAYNHCDSYPSGLGIDMLVWLRMVDADAARERAIALRVVQSDSKPTGAEVESLKRYANIEVGEQGDQISWYQVLRETQGAPGAMLDAGVIQDASNFPADSLWAEWGYVVDFDAKVFEVYEGFQHDAHGEGRFADMPRVNDNYAPVRLVASWSLSDLPDNDTFLAVEGVDA